MPSSVPPPCAVAFGKEPYTISHFSVDRPVEFTFTFTPPITPGAEVATLSPAGSARSSPALANSSPLPTPKKSRTGHVPRPPNPFILFRSDLISKEAKSIGARDFRHISRIAGHLWRNLPDDEKKVFQDKADQLKREHNAMHPDYNFRPEKRVKRKRNVYGNGADRLSWCATVADLVKNGLKGDELAKAVADLPAPSEERPKKRRRAASASARKSKAVVTSETPSPSPSPSSSTASLESSPLAEPPFTNPLLPVAHFSSDFVHYDIAPVESAYSPYEEIPYYEGQLFATTDTMNPFPDYPPTPNCLGAYDPSGYYIADYGGETTFEHASSSYDNSSSQWNGDALQYPY